MLHKLNTLFNTAAGRQRARGYAALLAVSLAARLPAWWVAGGSGGWPAAKLPALAADLCVALLLYRMLARLAPEAPLRPDEKIPPFWTAAAFWLALAWAAHPLAVLVSAVRGGYDTAALALVMLAAWFVEFSDHPRSDRLAAAAFAAALCLQVWPLALLPVFLKSYAAARERAAFALVALLPAALLSLPQWAQGAQAPVAAAPGQVGAGAALALALEVLGRPWPLDPLGQFWASVAPSLALALAYLVSPWRFPLLPGLALSALALMLVLPALPVQALAWPLAFSLAVPGGLALRLGLAGLAAGLLYFGLREPGTLFLRGSFFAPAAPGWFKLAWASVNIGLWYFWAREALVLLQWCRRPARLRFR